MPLTITGDNSKVKQQHFIFGTVYIHIGTVKIVFWGGGKKKLIWSFDVNQMVATLNAMAADYSHTLR